MFEGGNKSSKVLAKWISGQKTEKYLIEKD